MSTCSRPDCDRPSTPSDSRCRFHKSNIGRARTKGQNGKLAQYGPDAIRRYHWLRRQNFDLVKHGHTAGLRTAVVWMEHVGVRWLHGNGYADPRMRVAGVVYCWVFHQAAIIKVGGSTHSATERKQYAINGVRAITGLLEEPALGFEVQVPDWRSAERELLTVLGPAPWAKEFYPIHLLGTAAGVVSIPQAAMYIPESAA